MAADWEIKEYLKNKNGSNSSWVEHRRNTELVKSADIKALCLEAIAGLHGHVDCYIAMA